MLLQGEDLKVECPDCGNWLANKYTIQQHMFRCKGDDDKKKNSELLENLGRNNYYDSLIEKEKADAIYIEATALLFDINKANNGKAEFNAGGY